MEADVWEHGMRIVGDHACARLGKVYLTVPSVLGDRTQTMTLGFLMVDKRKVRKEC